jgi:hypothetical protein
MRNLLSTTSALFTSTRRPSRESPPNRYERPKFAPHGNPKLGRRTSQVVWRAFAKIKSEEVTRRSLFAATEPEFGSGWTNEAETGTIVETLDQVQSVLDGPSVECSQVSNF